eukprot:scaffold17764_cov33-Tisochrysis_lutea.AAC.3
MLADSTTCSPGVHYSHEEDASCTTCRSDKSASARLLKPPKTMSVLSMRLRVAREPGGADCDPRGVTCRHQGSVCSRPACPKPVPPVRRQVTVPTVSALRLYSVVC